MIPFKLRVASLASTVALLCVASPPGLAASSAASSASDSITTSVGSASGSIKRSSDSSSRGTGVAEGDYRIIEVALAPEQPGMARMKLQAVTDAGPDGEFFLYLPQTVVEHGRLAQGGVVSARQRPYGIEFAQGDAASSKQAFFLVLNDDWFRELHTTPVVL